MPTPYQMTPKRHFLAGVLGGRVDRPPLGSPTAVLRWSNRPAE
jgi:hypothetical protein